MNDEDDFEDEHGSCGHHPPDRGVLSPRWVFRAMIVSSNPVMRWNALAGLARHLDEAHPNECFLVDEIIDIVVQYMYTMDYVDPFAYVHEGETENPITEDEIEFFKSKLEFWDEEEYTDDEDND